MRQSAQQVELEPSWKQEVNRRVAEHKGRKAGAAAGGQNAPAQHAPGTRAAQAAARVAARYAKAPSYSDMLADEARAAVRAAEVASRAALEAQAVAESVLAGLEAASSAAESWETDLFPVPDPTPILVSAPEPARSAAPAAPAPSYPAPSQSFAIRWDTDLPVRESSPALARASHGNTFVETPAQDQWSSEHIASNPLETEGFEVVEAAQPIHANLIEFPRELVATRKVRPRRAEGPYAASVEAAGQLSIFEVEPWTVSTDPAAHAAAATAAFTGPEWSGIELDEEPQLELATPSQTLAPATWAEPAPAAVALELASTNRRLLAAIVDLSLIAGSFLATAALAVANLKTLPPIKEIEVGSAVALALIAVFYQAVFFTLAKATPGMKYARLELRTFSGERPVRAQRSARFAALMLSLLPVGLGVVWSLFDDQHLCWHDRLSKTYPRKA